MQVSFNGGEEPRYCDVKKTLYFRNGFKMMAVPLEFGKDRSIRTGQPWMVFENSNWINVPWYSYEVSRDGKRFLLILRDRKESTNEIKIIQNLIQ
jgi:hypothetical protein